MWQTVIGRADAIWWADAMMGPAAELAGASPEKAARGYGAPFATWIGPGARGGQCEAHQMLDDGGEAV
jgi:hypothetical protein